MTSALGAPLPSRKRARDNDDFAEGPPAKKNRSEHGPWVPDGSILRKWSAPAVKTKEVCTPWLSRDYSDVSNGMQRLHYEILDFYDYIRPRDFETGLRARLVRQIDQLVKRFYDAEVRSFGSFAVDMFLPTGDIDLVILSHEFLEEGRPQMCQSFTKMNQLATRVRQAGFAKDNYVEIVSKARVPLVKFVDRSTDLRVDISFETISGLNAIQLYRDWKEQYPRMEVLVSVIKQFLIMHGLNEVFTGGMSSFTVTCLVISMLQHQQPAQFQGPESSMAEYLLHFLNFYGKDFNSVDLAISLNPPAYFPKVRGVEPTYNILHPFLFLARRSNNVISIGFLSGSTAWQAFDRQPQRSQRRHFQWDETHRLDQEAFQRGGQDARASHR